MSELGRSLGRSSSVRSFNSLGTPDPVWSKYSILSFHRNFVTPPRIRLLLILDPSMTDNQGQSEDIWEGHTTWLIHDGDKKFCASFKDILDSSGVKRVPLPPRSPWLNSFAERWVQSVKTEALSQMILFGERSLRYVLSEYIAHHHTERPHQGKGNVILFPSGQAVTNSDSPIECRERLGGLLKYYHRKAA